MEININCGAFGKMFGVPCETVDKYLKLANENQLKVLLLFLRYSGQNISFSQAAKFLNISESAVSDSIDFWKKTSLFENINTSKITTDTPRESILSPSTLADMSKNKAEFEEVHSMIEKTIGRKLNNQEIQGISYIHNELGYENASIVTIFKYCSSIGKLNINYVVQIASSWKEDGIVKLSDVTQKVDTLMNGNAYKSKIYKLFKLKNAMTSNQEEFVELWHRKGYSDEILKLAYENAIERINKVNFKYINTTLLNWEKSGIKTPADLKKYNNKKKYSSDGESDLEKYKQLANNFGDIK